MEPLETPRVDPIGIVRVPEGYVARPRVYPRVLRAAASVLLAVFALVVVVSTSVSLGAYCLTSDGSNLAGLQPWLSRAPAARSAR